MCFFKQKTAYEMRISDWSSDVCSSDLPCADLAKRARGAHQPVVLERAFFGAADLDRRVGRRPRLRTVQPLERQLAVELIVMLCRVGEMRVQIGRASCRERVCQYVSI